MAARRKLLLISEDGAPANLRNALGTRWELSPCAAGQALEDQLSGAGLAVIHANGHSDDLRHLGQLLATVERTDAVALLLLDDRSDAGWDTLSSRHGQFLCLRSSTPAKEIAAQLSAAAALQPVIRDLRKELHNAREIVKSHSGAVEELDEELRLAARLQRDFLPRRLPEVGKARFGVLYRPASWLSGDIYDIVRLDERHVGFYVANAVGHGMPAALLTMFIKHALQTKRIVGNTYQIVPPEVSLSELNADICQQNLTSCQFCTAVYGVLDVQDLRLTYSRAGHPPPIVIHADGTHAALDAPGSLLGVFPEEEYESRTTPLRPGDRLLVFSDGAEEALRTARQAPGADFGVLVGDLAKLGRDELLLALTALIDQAKANPSGEDDVTVMIVDIET